MSQINRYDGTHITNNVSRLVESVIDLVAKKKSLETSERNVQRQVGAQINNALIAAEASKHVGRLGSGATQYGADVSGMNTRLQTSTSKEIAGLRTSTDLEIAKQKRDLDRELAYFRGNIDILLKNMGVNGDLLLEGLKHVNLKDRMKFEEELQEKLESFKQPLMLQRIEEEYQNNLRLANFNADEAFARTMIQQFGNIVSSSSILTGAEKAAVFAAIEKAWEYTGEKGSRKRNDYSIGMINDDRSLVIDPNRRKNYEELKPGWEMRKSPEQAIKDQENLYKTRKGRGFKGK